jgi:hypothetical protein
MAVQTTQLFAHHAGEHCLSEPEVRTLMRAGTMVSTL